MSTVMAWQASPFRHHNPHVTPYGKLGIVMEAQKYAECSYKKPSQSHKLLATKSYPVVAQQHSRVCCSTTQPVHHETNLTKLYGRWAFSYFGLAQPGFLLSNLRCEPTTYTKHQCNTHMTSLYNLASTPSHLAFNPSFSADLSASFLIASSNSCDNPIRPPSICQHFLTLSSTFVSAP